MTTSGEQGAGEQRSRGPGGSRGARSREQGTKEGAGSREDRTALVVNLISQWPVMQDI